MEVVELPCTQVTAVTSTGAELTDLIITTARDGLGDQAETAAGALFTVRLGVSGSDPAYPEGQPPDFVG